MMETSNEKIQEVGRNIQDKAALVWSVADDLVGAFKPHEYGLVVLPMAVIKRFHDCLLPTHDKVRETYAKVEKLAVKDGFLKKASPIRAISLRKRSLPLIWVMYSRTSSSASQSPTTRKQEPTSPAAISSI